MIEKHIHMLKIKHAEALNKTNWSDLYQMKRIKKASITKDQIDLNGFDIKAAIKDHPDHLFVKIFAIKKDEVNDNGDAFSAAELKKAAHTFIGVPIFTNHQNDDIEKAKGKCVHSWYDDEAGGIFIIAMVDSVAYPRLARGISEGYIVGTSMGCSVDYSLCSVCHNKAAVADEYCEHIRNRKNKKYSGEIECQYHNSKSKPTDDCPVCGKKKDIGNVLKHADAHIHEWNFNIKFIEDSLVVNPACHDCLVCEILNADAVNKRIASVRERIEGLNKAASCTTGCSLEKYAGQRELTYLADVMDKIEIVAKSMMAQKKYVSMEYVSNIVDVLASIQSVTDELTEMGYAQVPSPDITAVESVQLPKTSEEAETLEKTPQTTVSQPQPQVSQVPPAGQPVVQPGPSGTATEQMGNLGTVTKPKLSEIIDIKKKEFLKASSNLIERLNNMQREYTIAENQSINTDNFKVETDKESIAMANEKTGTETDATQKVAASPQAHSTDVITEKQLDEAKFTGERVNNPPSVILEKRLDNKSEAVNDTTSVSPQTRTESYPDRITEKQFDNVKSGYVVRWNDYPESITEKQWTDTSRWIGSVLSEKQDNRITEKQLADFLSKHRYVEQNTITEKQLNAQDGDLSRYAYNAEALVKAAANAISDVIAFYGKTPEEVKVAASKINENARAVDKAAFLTLINALPHKSESKVNERSRISYFSKLASSNVNSPDTIDALVTAMSDYVGDMSADDLVETIYHVASSNKTLSAIEDLAKTKLSKGTKTATVVDKRESLKKAMAGLNKSDDGKYEVTFENGIGVDPSKIKKSAFVRRAFKFASKQISEDVGDKVDIAVLDIKIAKNGDVVVTAKDVNYLTDEEKESWNKVAGGWNYMAGGNIDAALPAAGGQQQPSMAQPQASMGQGPMKAMEDDDEFNDMSYMSYMKDENFEDEDLGDEDLGDEDLDMELEDADLDLELGDEDIEGEDFEDDEDIEGEIENDEIDDITLDVEDNLEPDGLGEGIDLKIDFGKPMMASSKKTVKKANREQIVKEAQLLGGEMGGQAGAAQTPGAGATMPQPPAGGAPLESFEQSDLAGEFNDDAGDKQPKPPGSLCPVCGSEDVDIIKGQGKCNNCTSEMRFKIDVEVTKWAGLTGDENSEEGEGEGDEFELPATPEGGEAAPPAAPAAGGAAPAAPAAGGMPAAASTKNDKVVKTASIQSAKINKFAAVTVIKPVAAKKLAESKTEIGTVSPITGSTNTIKIAKGKHLCLDSGICYEVDYAVDAKDPKKVYAQFSWKPQDDAEGCSECQKARLSVLKALENKGITEEAFDAMSAKEMGDLILSLRASGDLKTIKTASSETSVISRIKEASVADLSTDIFPIESCVERIARRYGEDAVAISGPCEGKKLADCVCKSLKKAGVYSHGLAIKVADIWREKDASMECLEDFVREGYELKEAAAICETMKAKYASIDDKLAQEINEMIESEEPVDVDINVESPETDGSSDMVTDLGDEDPFEAENITPETEAGKGVGSENLASPPEGSDPVADAIVDLVKALGKEEEVDAALDVTLGENPDEEEHHQEIPVETPEETEIEIEAPEASLPEGETEVDVNVEPEAGEEVDIQETPEGAAIEIQDETKPFEAPENIEENIEDIEDVEEKEEEAEEFEEKGEELEEKGEEIEEEAEETEKKKLDRIKEILNEKEGDSEEELNEDKTVPGVMNPEDTDEKVEKEGDDMDKEAYTEDEAMIMRRGYVGRTNEMNHLDFSKLASIVKGADTVKTKPAQDAVPFKYQGDSLIGDEQKQLKQLDKPNVPNKGDSSKMGDEQPPKAEKASVPTSDARMSGEKDNKGLKPELDDTATGGDQGQGSGAPLRAASTNASISRLAEAILAQTKTKRKFVQDDEDIKPISGGDAFIGDEKSSIGDVPEAKPAAEQNVPRADAFIGNEKDSIGDKPSEKDMPSIPTTDARISGEKENDKIKSEKTDELTGNLLNNVSAGSKARRKEATRIAGRMLQAGKIAVEDLDKKIAQLERYDVEQLKDFEKEILDSQKGLNASSGGGIEQPVIIREASALPNKVASSRDELAEALTSMMTLARNNKIAQEDETIQLRQAFKYGNSR